MSHLRHLIHPQTLRLSGGAVLLLLSALFHGCSSDTHPTGAAERSGPRLEIVEPRDGDTAAETLRVRVELDSASPVDRVTLLVDGAEATTSWTPPWRFTWPAPVTDSTWVLIEARAYDEVGRAGRSDPIRVLLIPNHLPLVRIDFPHPDHYIARGALAARPWIARGTDPDEAALPDASLTWTTGAGTILGHGRTLAAPDLDTGLHVIRLEARDRWGASALDRRRVTIFVSPPIESPADLLQTFLLAIRARDPAVLEDCLHPDLLWSFCSGADPLLDGCGRGRTQVRWTRTDIRDSLGSLLEDPGLHRIGWSWAPGSVEEFRRNGLPVAKVEVAAIDMLASVRGEGVLRTALSRGNRARIYLLQDAGSWRIWEWIGFPPDHPHPGDVSLPDLMQGRIESFVKDLVHRD